MYIDFFGVLLYNLPIGEDFMIKREAEKMVEEINKTFRVLLVTGPRQVGKTTLLLNLKPKNMEYVSLDDEILRKQAQEDPKLFLSMHPAPLLIDEVQYAPQLFPYIKINVDNEKKRGMYWLTGSQQFKLMKNVTESLAGRVGIVNLNSLSYSEVIGNENKLPFDPFNFYKVSEINVNELYEHIFKGGMPELYDIKGMNKTNFFEGYINTYLSRDVKEQSNVSDLLEFKKFMVALASRNGEQLNYSSISKELGITDKTVKSWINILVTSGIVYLLEPYMSSKIKRITHIPKVIFMDTGLASYLAGWDNARDLQMSSSSGHYLETFVISEIIKSYNAIGIEPNISYYRDKEKNEIDLIFYRNNKLIPFEIKKTAMPNVDMIKNFKKLENTGKEIGEGGIICFYEMLTKLNRDNYIIPISSVINISKNDKKI